jgi:hypothetical protein
MLVDIQLKDGDLLAHGDDLAILTSPGDIIRHLVRRAILTPLGYLSRPVLEQGECRYVDAPYGDGIYLELGEPFTYDFLSRARKHIEKALYYAPQSVTIEDISLAFLSAADGPMNAISIRILYNHGEGTEELVFEVPLP